jgi:hypothetical protein
MVLLQHLLERAGKAQRASVRTGGVSAKIQATHLLHEEVMSVCTCTSLHSANCFGGQQQTSRSGLCHALDIPCILINYGNLSQHSLLQPTSCSVAVYVLLWHCITHLTYMNSIICPHQKERTIKGWLARVVLHSMPLSEQKLRLCISSCMFRCGYFV